MTIQTPAGDLESGERYDLVLRHGTSERTIRNGVVRAFEQDGEMRYEIAGSLENWNVPEGTPSPATPTLERQTVGFLAENVRALTALD